MSRIWLLLGLLLGCPESKKAEAPVERAQPSAPESPLHMSKPDEVRVQLDLSAARSAIQQKIQIEGAAPPTIDGLGLRLHYPSDLIYDPAAGTVRSRTYPQH
jgi:hypothetical protein